MFFVQRSMRPLFYLEVRQIPELTLRESTPAERMYAYTQSVQIVAQTGCIGHLRGDMDSSGTGFFTSWDDHIASLKTEEFKREFDGVIRKLRTDPRYGGMLENRTSLARFCSEHPDSRMEDGVSCGFRADTEEYVYLCRLNPQKGDYNFYIYAYLKKRLDTHLRNASRGIRFIDSRYGSLFRIPDGGKIRITFPDGSRTELVCRYIDEYHLEAGRTLFHICEFAERMERNGNKVEPVSQTMEPEQRKEKRHAGIDR